MCHDIETNQLIKRVIITQQKIADIVWFLSNPTVALFMPPLQRDKNLLTFVARSMRWEKNDTNCVNLLITEAPNDRIKAYKLQGRFRQSR